MASDIAQAQEMGKEARIQAFDIVAPANLQGQHFGVIGAKRLDKSSPTPPVTLRSTPYPTIPPVYLRPTSLSSRLPILPPHHPPALPAPPSLDQERFPAAISGLFSYIPISLPHILPPSYPTTLLPPNKTPAAADLPAIPPQRLLGARCRFRVPRRGRRWPGRRRRFAPPAAC